MKKNLFRKRPPIGAFKRTWLVMKLTFLLIFTGLLSVNASESYSQIAKINLNLRSVSIIDVFQKIEDQSEFAFIYKNEVIDLDRKVSITTNQLNIESVLQQLLEDTNLDYEIFETQIILTRKKASPAVQNKTLKGINEQQEVKKKISGKVTGADGMTIPGVSIAVVGTTVGTITDIDGNFSLDVSENAEFLSFSFIGFESQEVAIGNETVFNIVLLENVIGVDEIVIVGYGSQRKETVTGSISSVKSKEIVKSPVANISNALVGRAAGVTATQLSGEPGNNSATIRIRGVGTLNGGGQEPLVIIDGMQSTFAVMNNIDANEIESVNILKDVSATAVYGVKGANGVVIVTTKRGKEGKTQINFSSNYGVTRIGTGFEMLGSYDYARYRNEAIKNDNDQSFNHLIFSDDELWKFQNNRDYTPAEVEQMNLSPEQKNALLNSPALYYNDNDHYDEQFGGIAPQQKYNLNISGGTKGFSYFTSVGYFNQKGNINDKEYADSKVNSTFERYNFRSNFDIDLAKTLKAEIDISGQYSTSGMVLGNHEGTDNTANDIRYPAMLMGILSTAPYIGSGFKEGRLIGNYANNPLSEKGAMGGSPYASLFWAPYMTKYNSNLNTKMKLIHTLDYLLQGLSLSGTVSYNGNYTKAIKRERSIPAYTATRNPENPSDILFFGGSSGPVEIEDNFKDGNYKWRQLNIETALNYKRTFDRHSVTGLVLYNAQKIYDPNLLYNVPNGLVGLVGRATYSFSNKYLAEVNIGYNGSENFPEDKRYGFFPAVSLGWVASSENFFPETDWITWFKVRASYGEVGNDQIGGRRFLYLPSTWSYGGNYNYEGYYFGDSNGGNKDPYYPGAVESTVGNPIVTWEKAKKANVGLEMHFLKNKLSFVGDIFSEKRDDILWNLGTVPGIVGANLPPANIGKVTNQGFEMQLGWIDTIGEVEYGINGNMSYAKNTIDFMDEPSYPHEWMNSTGLSIGQYKGYVTDGFYNTEEEVANHPYSTIDRNRVQVGDLRYVDINGDGVLDVKDKVPIGYSNLPRIAFGTSLFVNYKGFSVSALFTGSAQGSFNMAGRFYRNPFYQTTAAAFDFQYEGRWTPEKAAQGITPTYPRASLLTQETISGVDSDFWIKSTDHIRLKNVEISYTFKKLGALSEAGIGEIRVYANGSNLYTWSKLRDRYGIDPEQQDAAGANQGMMYPMTQVYNFGFSVQF